MGRQIAFHMLQEDKEEFFRFLTSKHHVFAAVWTSDNPEVVQCESPAREMGTLAIWEPHPGTRRERKKIVRDDAASIPSCS